MQTAYPREDGHRNPGRSIRRLFGPLLRPATLAVLLPVLLAIALRLPFLSAPLERDEGEYAYIAWRLIQKGVHGGVPYLDTFDQKPPGIFGLYALAFALFGRRIESIRLVLALWGAAGTALIALLARRFNSGLDGDRAPAGGDLQAGPRADPVAGPQGGPIPGSPSLAAPVALATLATGTVFALLTNAPTLWATAANAELFMLLPLLGALALAFPDPRGPVAARPGRLAAVGALLAAAFLFKQVAAFAALALLPFLLARRPEGSRSAPSATTSAPRGAAAAHPLLGLAALIAGGLALLAPVALAFAAAGAFAPMLDCVLLHDLRYAGSSCVSWESILDYALRRIALPHWPSLLLALVGSIAAARSRRPVWRFVLLWLVAGLASAGLGCRFFPHYFLAAVPPLALLAGLGVASLAGLVERSSAATRQGEGRGTGALTGALALLLAVGIPLSRELPLFLWTSPGTRSHTIYGPEIFPGSQPLGEYIRSRTRPEDAVLIIGSEPQVLFHAERRSATRYIFLDPLLGDFPDAQARQREAVADIARADPTAILFMRLATSLGGSPTDDSLFLRTARSRLQHGYDLQGAVFLTLDGTDLALGPDAADLPPETLRRAAALLYLRTPPPAAHP